MAKKLWVIYDERAVTEGTDEATVLSSATSLKEAQTDLREMGYGVIYEYDVADGDQLINERLVRR